VEDKLFFSHWSLKPNLILIEEFKCLLIEIGVTAVLKQDEILALSNRYTSFVPLNTLQIPMVNLSAFLLDLNLIGSMRKNAIFRAKSSWDQVVLSDHRLSLQNI
jgi:hypothetical protein